MKVTLSYLVGSTNLWEETIRTLENKGKTWLDVLAVQSDDIRISKEKFETLAKNTNYYNGYGAQEVAADLVLIGKNWWCTRGEYDGSEWWEFHAMPKLIKYDKEKESKIKTLLGRWSTVSEIIKHE